MKHTNELYYGFFIERNDESFVLNLIKKDDLIHFKQIANGEIELDKKNLNLINTPFLEISKEEPLVKNLFRGPTLNLYSNSWIKLLIEIDERGKSIIYDLPDQDNQSNCKINFFEKMNNLDEETKSLVRTFSLNHVEESSVTDIEDVFNKFIESFSNIFISIYDVGQGNCNAICKSDGTPILYFDVGCGCGPNSKSFPPNLKICTCAMPPIILSHWHQDHYGSVKKNPNLLDSFWLAKKNPKNLSPDAFKVASYLHQKKTLMIYPSSISSINLRYGKIINCTGTTPNDSGLAFISNIHDELTLFSGDSNYNHILLDSAINNLIVSHHGGANTNIPPNSSKNNSHFYSYGLNNSYNHPNKKTVILHSKTWFQRMDTCNGSIGLFTSKINTNVNYHSQTVCFNHSTIQQNIK